MLFKKKNGNRIKKTVEDHIVDTVVTIILAVFALVCFYPMWYVLVASLSTSSHVIKNPGLLLWPDGLHLDSYFIAFEHPLLMGALWNSVKILIISLPINIVLTMMCGYFMASTNVKFKKPIITLLMITMYFNGGLIPTFLNVRELGLYNSHWALVLPGALSVYNAIICKTAIEGIPASLSESAYLDGANDVQVLFRIIMPLIKPTLAVLVLYYGVGHWNSWFAASIYLEENELMPIQNILRAVLNTAKNSTVNNGGVSGLDSDAFAEAVKYSAIVISTVPILCVYPFLQKHFAKGAMIGAVKG